MWHDQEHPSVCYPSDSCWALLEHAEKNNHQNMPALDGLFQVGDSGIPLQYSFLVVDSNPSQGPVFPIPHQFGS
jgi:hypothetical protein